jgi:hypothetical protein
MAEDETSKIFVRSIAYVFGFNKGFSIQDALFKSDLGRIFLNKFYLFLFQIFSFYLFTATG